MESMIDSTQDTCWHADFKSRTSWVALKISKPNNISSHDLFDFFGWSRDAHRDVLMTVNGNETPEKAGDGLPMTAKNEIAGMVT